MSAKKTPNTPEAVKIIKGKLKIRPGKPAPVIAAQTVYTGPLFRIDKEQVNEPKCPNVIRDIVRHGGSVVILAIDDAKKKIRSSFSSANTATPPDNSSTKFPPAKSIPTKTASPPPNASSQKRLATAPESGPGSPATMPAPASSPSGCRSSWPKA